MTIKELDGKLEGIATALLYLIGNIEQQGLIDGPMYCQSLYRAAGHNADNLSHEANHLRSVALNNLAVMLDQARENRRALSGP